VKLEAGEYFTEEENKPVMIYANMIKMFKKLQQFVPSQTKVLNGGGDLREVQVDAPLSAIPTFDCIAGLHNRHLNSKRGICLR